ncbi:FAD-dependent monooxygenase [Nocardia huaxiensis]|uniref:FAD-dependent monooxygenase n=1 Tax=Nocardia huaxiensis TaxID=2755382 RepID=A0A7D6ZCW6_9NOCA|nr:FAD-dependent monooxygenase [Nocardia huaxiensis]QLY27919.1 FAD-dependent monooxygenase [Nocardia huaxiensis]
MNSPVKSAIVVGAGIGGLTAAAALRRAGIDVVLCERGPELRAAGFGLSVQSNAMNALRTLDLGIDEELLRVGGRARSFTFRYPDGSDMRRVDVAPIDAELGAPAVAVARKDLHEVLLAACGDDLRVETGAEAVSFSETADAVEVRFADGRTLSADVLIGADGINSAVRAQLHGSEAPRPGKFVCWLALVPFAHAAIEPGASIHYWGRGMRFGIHDIGHGNVYWWGTMTTSGELAANWPHGKADLLSRFAGWAPEITEIITATPEADILALPAQDRPPLTSWGRGRVTLLGDAAHPMLPSLGQGANAAMEDAVVLAHALATHEDAATGLRVYEQRRIPRTTMFVDGSRKLGRIEQTRNRAVIAVRNAFIAKGNEEKLRANLAEPMTWPGLGDAEPVAALPRPLSTLERWHWTADQVAPLHIVSRVRVTGDLDADAVRAGLAALVRRHPILHAVVRSEGGRDPRFVPIEVRPIPLREVAAGEWTAEIDTELRERFDADAPLLRATLITVAPGVHDLVLTSTYTIADAVTVLSFARQVLELAAATTGWLPEVPAPASPEALFPKPFQGARGKGRAIGRLVADGLRDMRAKPVRLTPGAEVAPAQRFTRVARRVLDGAEYQALVAACEQRDVALSSVVAAALARAAGADAGAPQANYPIGVSVLFREQLARPLDTTRTGAYQAMIALPTPAGRPLWEAAAEFDAEFSGRVAQRQHLANLGGIGFMMPKTPAQSDKVVKLLDARGPGHLCLTYLDTRDFPSRIGDWEISGAEFVSGMSISGMTMLTVGLGADELSLNLGYIEGLLSPDRADALVGALADGLRSAVPASETAAAH